MHRDLRGRIFDSRLRWDVSVFYMDFTNLDVPQNINGLRGLANTGDQRFRGGEVAAPFVFTEAWALSASWSHHQAHFGDYERLFGGNLAQLRGSQQELTPRYLTRLSLMCQPMDGMSAYVTGIGCHTGHWDFQIDGTNPTDHRDPINESELDDGEYYRLAGKSVWLTFAYGFGG